MHFYFRMSFLYIWKFDYNEVAASILAQRNRLALKHYICHFLPVPWEKDIFPINVFL